MFDETVLGRRAESVVVTGLHQVLVNT